MQHRGLERTPDTAGATLKSQVPLPWALVSPSNQKLRWSEGAVGWEGQDAHLEVPIGCDAQPVAGPTEML